MTPPLILASASPRRRALLASLGVPFTTHQSDIDERRLPDEPPPDYALRMAEEKPRSAAAGRQTGLVIGADTIVVLDGQVLGKPTDAAMARTYLTLLRGRRHRVATAVAVVDAATRRTERGIAWTDVWIREFDTTEMEAYIASGDPFDKAGAYAIQDRTFRPVARFEGAQDNVVGLPLTLVRRLIDRLTAATTGL